MIHLLLVIIYLAFISLGLPDALLGSAMAVHVQGIFCSGFIFRDNIHDHSGGNDRFQPAERPSDQTVGNRQSNCGQRAADSCRAVWFFRQRLFPGALPLGGSLRPRGRKRGRRP